MAIPVITEGRHLGRLRREERGFKAGVVFWAVFLCPSPQKEVKKKRRNVVSYSGPKVNILNFFNLLNWVLYVFG